MRVLLGGFIARNNQKIKLAQTLSQRLLKILFDEKNDHYSGTNCEYEKQDSIVSLIKQDFFLYK